LTPRQLEVLSALALLDSRKQAAQSLGISVSAVDKHLDAAAQRLGTTRRHVVMAAMQRGLL